MASSSALRDYLRHRAGWVWRGQARAFDHGLSLQEETLTEMLLLRMAQDHAKNGLSVTMFSKPVEAIVGADWEWIIRTRGCEMGLRIQAKRLYRRGTGPDYGGLDPKSTQVDKLIQRAGSSIPIYVFYNHDHGTKSALLNAGGEHPYRGRSYWGCSMANAHAVKAKQSNSLKDLRDIMKPWHHLVTDTGACGVNAALGISDDARRQTMTDSRRQVVERVKDPEFMLDYLATNELTGVAVMDFSEFRG